MASRDRGEAGGEYLSVSAIRNNVGRFIKLNDFVFDISTGDPYQITATDEGAGLSITGTSLFANKRGSSAPPPVVDDVFHVVRSNFNLTLSRSAERTILVRNGVSDAYVTVDMSFKINDEIFINQTLDTAGTLTLAISGGVLKLPDGTSAATNTVTGRSWQVKIRKMNSTDWELI